MNGLLTSRDREIWRLTLPNIVSNISVPLIGLADTAIAGHVGGDAGIGAVSIGTTIFNIIYWNCGFLRMGCSGLTAQAYGRGDREEVASILTRGLTIALFLSAVLLLSSGVLIEWVIGLFSSPERVEAQVREYVWVRIWAIPASVSLFAFAGWMIGMQDPKSAMIVTVSANVINVAASAVIAIWMEKGIAGVAIGTVVAQWAGVVMSVVIVRKKYGREFEGYKLVKSLKVEPFRKFLRVGGDIFVRTLCIVTAFTLFTVVSSWGGEVVLATNTLMMQLFVLFSYIADGLAYSAESIVGKLIGAQDREGLRDSTRRLMAWGVVVGLLYTGVYLMFWREILTMFGPSEEVLVRAGGEIGWGIAMPMAGLLAFILDGVMIGATQTRWLLFSVAGALLSAVVVAFLMQLSGSEQWLWPSFSTFMVMRGVLLVPGYRKIVSCRTQ